jgi:hypothetical protein
MPRVSERDGHVTQDPTSHASGSSQEDACDEPITTVDRRVQKRKRKAPNTPQAVIEVDEENKQGSGSLDLRTMLKTRLAEVKRKRQQAALEKQLLEVGSEEAPINTLASGINGVQQSLDLDLDGQPAGNLGDASLSNDYGAREPLHGSGDVNHFSDPDDGLDHSVDETLINDIEHIVRENASEQGGQHDDSFLDQGHQSVQTATTPPSMTPREKELWAMNFEELYQHAKSKNFGKRGKEGRKAGRVRIIRWLCEKDGITPYVAPSITPIIEATPIIARPTLRPTGAISHPEAILRTSDPTMQSLIDEREKKYREWPAADLLTLAMKRSYQLLKDSKGKLPSKSISAMSNWLAAWDVLKSPREKKWWLGDGIDLVNRAKAMGYQGPSSKKYDVIVWLRSTPEDSEFEVAEVMEPTPNLNPPRHEAEEGARPVSKRPAKGSKRPHGWESQLHVLQRP